MHRPKCFGQFRSPQQDAEADCESCPHDAACMDVWKRVEAKNKEYENKYPATFEDWADLYGWKH